MQHSISIMQYERRRGERALLNNAQMLLGNCDLLAHTLKRQDFPASLACMICEGFMLHLASKMFTISHCSSVDSCISNSSNCCTSGIARYCIVHELHEEMFYWLLNAS